MLSKILSCIPCDKDNPWTFLHEVNGRWRNLYLMRTGVTIHICSSDTDAVIKIVKNTKIIGKCYYFGEEDESLGISIREAILQA